MPMKQQTLAMAADQSGYEHYRKPTRQGEFLSTMEAIVPWSALFEVIEPHYPKAGNGRPPIGLERMLRIHFIQHWFNVADLGCEEALYDSASLRRFGGIDLGRESVPDATTMLKFRRLLITNKLSEALFAHLGQELQARGFKVNTATIWMPPSSAHPTPPRMQTRRATPRCTRPAKASSNEMDPSTCNGNAVTKVEHCLTTRTDRGVTMETTNVGIDLAKNVFQVHGINTHGKVELKKQLKRDQMAAFFVNLPVCLIGIEACGIAHHWARKLQSMGHTVRLIARTRTDFLAGLIQLSPNTDQNCPQLPHVLTNRRPHRCASADARL